MFWLVNVYGCASAVGAFWVSFVVCFISAVEATEPELFVHVILFVLVLWVVKEILDGVYCMSFARGECQSSDVIILVIEQVLLCIGDGFECSNRSFMGINYEGNVVFL